MKHILESFANADQVFVYQCAETFATESLCIMISILLHSNENIIIEY